MNIIFASLKNSKNMSLIFCKVKKAQKTWISFFPSSKNEGEIGSIHNIDTFLQKAPVYWYDTKWTSPSSSGSPLFALHKCSGQSEWSSVRCFGITWWMWWCASSMDFAWRRVFRTTYAKKIYTSRYRTIIIFEIQRL